MVTPVEWPSVLKPRDFGLHYQNSDVSGGASVTGSEQFIASAGARWLAKMTLDINSNEKVLAIRALRTQLQGRAGLLHITNYDGKRLSWPQRFVGTRPTGHVLDPSQTRVPGLDGTEYATGEIPDESEIIASMYDNAAVRATQVTVKVTQGEAILAGQQFSVGNNFCEIGSVALLEVVPPPPPYVYILSIQPPLRFAAAADTPVNFTRPRVRVRVMNLDEQLTKLDQMRFATLNLDFAEFF